MNNSSQKVITGLIMLILLGGIIASLYATTLSSPFVFDDNANIVLNPSIMLQDLSLESFKKLTELSPNKRRLLPNLSFALNYYFDGYNVFGFHLVNIIIHIATAFVFFLLARTTLSLCTSAILREKTYAIAFFAALLWAVHPLQTNGVTYIVQRMTSMATLFCLLSLYSYVKARLAEKGFTRAWLFGAAALFAGMALLSKENSGMLPVIIAGYEFYFLPRPQKDKTNNKKAFIFYTLALLVFIGICLLFLGSNPVHGILAKFSSREFTLGQRLLTETRVVFHYLSLLILPLPSRLNLAYDYPLSTGLFAPPQTLLAILGLGILVVLIFWLYRRDRLASFALFWFFTNLLIESSVIALEIIFEHRMYMPSMFLILTATAWLFRITANKPAIAKTALLAATVILALLTWQRNSVWKTEISLWTDVLNKAPGSMRAHGNLGNAYSKTYKYPEAEHYLLQAVSIGHSDTSGNFSSEYMQKYLAKVHDNLSLVYREQQKYKKAIYEANLALELDPSRPDPLITLGIAFSKMDQHQRAYDYFLTAAMKGAESVDLYNNWAVSSYNLGKIDQSIKLLKHSITLDPDHPESHYNLGIAYSSKGMLEEAQREMQVAMKLRNKLKK